MSRLNDVTCGIRWRHVDPQIPGRWCGPRRPGNTDRMNKIAALLADQDRIISRRQALQAGLTRADIAGRLKRRQWVKVHPGVYAAQTGRLSWQQQAWAAVLAVWPAALSHESS